MKYLLLKILVERIEKIEIKENNLVFYSKGNSFLPKNKKQFIGYTGKDLPALFF